MTGPPGTTTARAPTHAGPDRPRGRRQAVVVPATVALGLALAVLVGRDGSPAWQVLRVLAVVLLTAVAVRSLRHSPRVVRGGVAVAVGVVGIAVGAGIGVFHLTHGALGVPMAAGLLALLAGVALVVAGTGLVLGAVHGGRRLLAVPVALALLILALYPLTVAVAATNAPRPELGEATPDRAYEQVSVETADGVVLSGWYLPSRNRAAVALLHGASSTRTSVLDQAEVLADGGYGVLLYDARGHGRSGGRAMELGWDGDLDVAAAVDLLAARPDVDPDRIGAVGLSMGGEQAVGAAAADPRLQAVVAEGATGRQRGDKGWLPTHALGQVQRLIDLVTYTATDLLTAARPPTVLRDAVREAAPRPVLLIAGGAAAAGAEVDAAEWIRSGAASSVEVWVVPGAGHTAGLATAPEQWRERVLGHLDRALLGP